MRIDTDIYWHEGTVSRELREAQNGHKGCVVWFTGLSASGRSTVANVLDHKLYRRNVRSVVLDGDNVRHGLNAGTQILRQSHGEAFAQRFGLGFSAMDREENIRRIGAVAKLFALNGCIAITAFISPYRTDRDRVRETLEPGEFIEILVDTPLEICEQRDPKGLYQKARGGALRGFTGIDAPYEPPLAPELVLSAGTMLPDILADEIIAYLEKQGIISEYWQQ